MGGGGGGGVSSTSNIGNGGGGGGLSPSYPNKQVVHLINREFIKKSPVAVAYPGFQREGCLRSGPIQQVGGGGASGPIYEKWGGGGGGALQVRYTKSGGGGGASGPIYEKWGGGGGGGGGGAIPLQVRYR